MQQDDHEKYASEPGKRPSLVSVAAIQMPFSLSGDCCLTKVYYFLPLNIYNVL
jgi:hypothetical protein